MRGKQGWCLQFQRTKWVVGCDGGSELFAEFARRTESAGRKLGAWSLNTWTRYHRLFEAF